MSIVGKKFPSVTLKAIDKLGDTYFLNVLDHAQKNKKKIVLFWYPKDFTFVCPTELHAFEEAKLEFEKRNCLIIGASCDTAEVHFAWLNIKKNNGGIQGISYPLLSDPNRNLCSILKILDGVELDYNKKNNVVGIERDNVSYRATYLIDEKGIVFYEGINYMSIGRNIYEYLRLIDAYTHVQKYGEVCPANWESGKVGIIPNRDGIVSFFNKK